MIYKINYDCDLEKKLAKIPKRDQNAIVVKIKSLSKDPRQTGSIKLKGHSLYRVKCGKYRVIYEIKDKQLIILIVDVDGRKDAYRGL
ncbi:MAG: type II toxin-antitoxin system RelE/ParE family toxin [Parachlamydia sp.]|jgi:mRNA interferase RelE/StbE|nr:type II toxin-antitoxin system RelE/ParE family toxin [Parachlamydia sp.]